MCLLWRSSFWSWQKCSDCDLTILLCLEIIYLSCPSANQQSQRMDRKVTVETEKSSLKVPRLAHHFCNMTIWFQRITRMNDNCRHIELKRQRTNEQSVGNLNLPQGPDLLLCLAESRKHLMSFTFLLPLLMKMRLPKHTMKCCLLWCHEGVYTSIVHFCG